MVLTNTKKVPVNDCSIETRRILIRLNCLAGESLKGQEIHQPILPPVAQDRVQEQFAEFPRLINPNDPGAQVPQQRHIARGKNLAVEVEHAAKAGVFHI